VKGPIAFCRPYPIYVLDTNVLIQAHRNYYSFDLAPGFWDSLPEFAVRIHVIDWVRSEMVDGHDDELAQWVRGAGAVLCQRVMDLDEVRRAVVPEYQAIVTLVQKTARFQERWRRDFLACADPWVIAYAKVIGGTVVTMEQPASAGSKVKIPDICDAVSVAWINTYSMLRSLSVQLRYV